MCTRGDAHEKQRKYTHSVIVIPIAKPLVQIFRKLYPICALLWSTYAQIFFLPAHFVAEKKLKNRKNYLSNNHGQTMRSKMIKNIRKMRLIVVHLRLDFDKSSSFFSRENWSNVPFPSNKAFIMIFPLNYAPIVKSPNELATKDQVELVILKTCAMILRKYLKQN